MDSNIHSDKHDQKESQFDEEADLDEYAESSEGQEERQQVVLQCTWRQRVREILVIKSLTTETQHIGAAFHA